MLKSLLLILLLITASCANDRVKSEPVETNSPPLKLNNGQKWKLDEATRQNMKLVKAHVAQATHTNVLSGEELQKHADKLIKECRMTGPDHDALHAWLGPFLQHVQALKTNRDAESASHALTEDMKLFDRFFE